MKKREFLKIQSSIKDKITNEHFISYAQVIDYINTINSWKCEIRNIGTQEKSIIDISKIYCLLFGLISFSTIIGDNNKDDNNEINEYKMLKICIHSLSSQISNDILSILKLTLTGLDFQAGILIRNLYELAFTILAIMIDKRQCRDYFESAAKDNEYDVWRNNFTMKKLNNTLELFEKSINDNEELSFTSDWRKKNYSFYSGFTHNDFFQCYNTSYTKVKTEDEHEIKSFNLWGGKATRITYNLEPINDLLMYTGLLFYKIIIINKIDKEKLITEREIWNNSFVISMIAEELYKKYLVENK